MAKKKGKKVTPPEIVCPTGLPRFENLSDLNWGRRDTGAPTVVQICKQCNGYHQATATS